jgi:hypothetical protein
VGSEDAEEAIAFVFTECRYLGREVDELLRRSVDGDLPSVHAMILPGT